jgi:membrane protease YdiL (CAAX protease family)
MMDLDHTGQTQHLPGQPPGEIGSVRLGPSAQPGLGSALLLLMIMFAVSAVALVLILAGARGAELDMLLLGLVQVLAMSLGLGIGLRWAAQPAKEVLLLRPVSLWMLLLPLPLAGACAIASNALDAPIQQVFRMPEEYVLYMVQLLYPENLQEWIRILAMAVVIIPLGEEMIFRGLFLRGFVLRYGQVPALALSAFLFALVHLNPWGFLSIFLAGWFMGWLVLRTGSLWPAVVLHGGFNLSGVLLLKASLDGAPTSESLANASLAPWDSPSMIVLATLVILLGLLMLGRFGRSDIPWSREARGPGAPVGER